jgi:FMN phosphatase YigB (HAD superfamily)
VTDSTDWRVTITLSGQANVEQARQSFSEQEVEQDVRDRLGRNIVIGAGDSQIFLYAGTELAAREAERTAREVLGQLGIEAEFALDRWHPIEEEWQSPDVAMPQTEAERQAEHQRLEAAETAESIDFGSARWQARAELPSHREAVALANKLQGEGYPVVRRWKFLIVGANDDDDARALAEHIRQEAPADAQVTAEPAGVRLPFIPF